MTRTEEDIPCSWVLDLCTSVDGPVAIKYDKASIATSNIYQKENHTHAWTPSTFEIMSNAGRKIETSFRNSSEVSKIMTSVVGMVDMVWVGTASTCP